MATYSKTTLFESSNITATRMIHNLGPGSNFPLLSWTWILVLVPIFLYSVSGRKGNATIKAPYVGGKWAFTARIYFLVRAEKILDNGYRQFKDTVFKLCGDDVLVLPNKYIDEIRNLPGDKLNSILANITNAQGVFSITDVLAKSNLHTRVIQTKLTPKLGALVPTVRDELAFALEKEFPPCGKNWTTIQIYEVLRHIVSRTSARVFVGPDLCRNEAWLFAADGYTENAFLTIIIMRLIPFWLKHIVSFFVPSSWKISYYFYHAKKVLVPVIAERSRTAATEASAMSNSQPSAKLELDNFLQMMMDEATGTDADPEGLAQRVLSLTLASNHTTTMALTQAFYDMCAHPEYITELREEVQQAVDEDGGWRKSTLTKMRKLDSFMKESQRVNPPSLTGFKRRVMEPLTLSDGLYLPPGSHIEMAIVPIQRDNTKDPDRFDGFRYYRMRLDPSQAQRHQFATTDNYTLHFGHGKFGCPGRFMASNSIKMILGQLLLDYDFNFPEGQSRPVNLPAFEYSFPNPHGKIMFRERRNA